MSSRARWLSVRGSAGGLSVLTVRSRSREVSRIRTANPVNVIVVFLFAGLALGCGMAPTPVRSIEEGASTGPLAMFAGDRFENFRNVDRFVPTSEMTASPDPWDLGDAEQQWGYRGDFLGEATSLEEFMESSNSSALLVIHDGKVIYERYAHGDSRASLHNSFSMAKSFTSALLGIALGEGMIGTLDDPIRAHLPELSSATFDDVTVRHLLQMSSGVRFNEDYTDPESDINEMTSAVPPMTYLEYINSLGRDHEPGTFNHYASINTQLLGFLIVRVTGTTLTDYMTRRLWDPLGMEQKGLWILDGQGIELAMGGLAASARDYAKLGLLYLNDGKRGDTQILPAGWARESVTPNEPHLMPGVNSRSSNDWGYMYQWWTPPDWNGDFLARGVWGQTLYVHPEHRVVIVKLAADQRAFDPAYARACVEYLQELARSLDN